MESPRSYRAENGQPNMNTGQSHQFEKIEEKRNKSSEKNRKGGRVMTEKTTRRGKLGDPDGKTAVHTPSKEKREETKKIEREKQERRQSDKTPK